MNMNSEKIIMIVIITLAAISILLLKLLNLRYKRKEKKKVLSVGDFSVIMPSYEQYERISQKASPKNKPKREDGDFFDYVFATDQDDSNSIENRLLEIYGEDLKEEVADEQ